MRIAYCIRAVFPQHGYGGLERAGTDLMKELLSQGVDIDLLTRRLPRSEPVRIGRGTGRLRVHTVEYGKLPLRANGIPARLTNYRSFVEKVGQRVMGLARSGIIDGIYAHGLCAWGVRRAGEWGVPLVVNPHGLEEFKSTDRLKHLAYTPFRKWMRDAGRVADRVIATDAAMRDDVARLLKIDPRKVVVLPNGIDLSVVSAHTETRQQSELIERWPFLLGSGGLRGVSVGRLEQNKGFEFLVRALGTAKGRLGPNWGWIIVGDGTLRAQLESLSGELGLQGHLFFAGHLSESELHNLYELSNLFAHASLFEGSSLVTLEAMAHGLPVVASVVGGIPDKVTNGVNGFLVEPGDGSALAEKISWLATHHEERTEMGKRSSLAVQRFDWREIAHDTKQLLEMLVLERAACRDSEVLPRAL